MTFNEALVLLRLIREYIFVSDKLTSANDNIKGAYEKLEKVNRREIVLKTQSKVVLLQEVQLDGVFLHLRRWNIVCTQVEWAVVRKRTLIVILINDSIYINISIGR